MCTAGSAGAPGPSSGYLIRRLARPANRVRQELIASASRCPVYGSPSIWVPADLPRSRFIQRKPITRTAGSPH